MCYEGVIYQRQGHGMRGTRRFMSCDCCGIYFEFDASDSDDLPEGKGEDKGKCKGNPVACKGGKRKRDGGGGEEECAMDRRVHKSNP